MEKKSIILVIVILFFLASCSAGKDISVAQPNSVSSEVSASEEAGDNSQNNNDTSDFTKDEYIDKLKRKGLEDWQIKSLAQRGFSFEDQLARKKEELDELLAPGCGPAYGREFSAEESISLAERNIDERKSSILRSLGYEFDNMMLLTNEQLDFIFPNTELVNKLIELGYKREAVIHQGAIIQNGYSNYKELLDEIFADGNYKEILSSEDSADKE